MNSQKLISVSGWGTAPSNWDPIISGLDDLICHIPIPWWKSLGDVPSSNELLRELEESDSPAIIAGWSLGALIALSCTVLCPERIAGLILVSGTACMIGQDDYPGVDEKVLRAMRIHLNRDPKSTLEDFGRLCIGNKDAEYVRQFVTESAQIGYNYLQNGLSILQTTDLRQTISDIEVPVMVLHGENDEVIPVASACYLAERLQNSEFEIISEGSHALLHTETEHVTRIIRKFLIDNFSE